MNSWRRIFCDRMCFCGDHCNLVTNPVSAQQGGPQVLAPATCPAEFNEDYNDNVQLLDRLFGQLHKAENRASRPRPVEQAIWQLVGAIRQSFGRCTAAAGCHGRCRPTPHPIGHPHPGYDHRDQAGFSGSLEQAGDGVFSRTGVRQVTGRHRQGARSGTKAFRCACRVSGSFGGSKGDDRGALEAFRRALSIHPHQESAKRAVKELETDFEQKI